MIVTYDEITNPSDLNNNKLHITDRAFHDWYRFVLSFPPHLVRSYIQRFQLDEQTLLLDPFCGTGTTIVEAQKSGITAIGVEAIPMAFFASRVKTRWDVFHVNVRDAAENILNRASDVFRTEHTRRTFSYEQSGVILKDSISPLPLHKCLILLDVINKEPNISVRDLCLLSLAHVSVHSASNLKFGPEVGVREKKKNDAPVFEDWFDRLSLMIDDLKSVQDVTAVATLCLGDSRDLKGKLEYSSIDAVITSPPYPNEKDYTRTTRLESTLLGFLKNKQDLRALKKTLVRSNTRNVYVSDNEDSLIPYGSKIDRIAREIERRRLALNKDSGFEKLYHRVTRLYFGGMKLHLESLKPFLKPGAKLAYVVGDQESYLRVHIPTGELLADIAYELGYKVLEIDLFRTRLSTATRKQLREEVVLLEWTGVTNNKGVKPMSIKKMSRYDQLIERVFFNNYKKGANEVTFNRKEFEKNAKKMKLILPLNLGDIIYSYRNRRELPERIRKLLKQGEEWVIRSPGVSIYEFSKSTTHRITPNPKLTRIKILDATPEIVRRYALNDEQALLAILRYNRLIDIFLGITCYSLQSHLKTTIPGTKSQTEIDEIYIGVSKKGEQFIVPIEAKGKKGQLGVVQIEQGYEICKGKFPLLTCRAVAAQFMEDDIITLFELEKNEGEIKIKEEKHYRLVPNEDLTDEELRSYRQVE